MLVEDKRDRTVETYGTIAFYDRDHGMGDYPNWLENVRSGKVKILWCPALGRVDSNEVYLAHWEV